MKYHLLTLAFLAFGATALPTQGASITVLNSDFDSPVLNPGGFTGNQITDGFTFVYAGVEYLSPGGGKMNFVDGLLPAPGNGHQLAFMNGVASNLQSYMYQDVGLLQANTTYTLTVALGWRNDQGAGAVSLGFNNDFQFTPGNTVLGVSEPFAATLQGGFQDISFSFTTSDTVSGDLTIFIQNVSGGTGVTPTVIDNVRLEATAVPEPATLCYLAGAAGLVFLIRRRRRTL